MLVGIAYSTSKIASLPVVRHPYHTSQRAGQSPLRMDERVAYFAAIVHMPKSATRCRTLFAKPFRSVFMSKPDAYSVRVDAHIRSPSLSYPQMHHSVILSCILALIFLAGVF